MGRLPAIDRGGSSEQSSRRRGSQSKLPNVLPRPAVVQLVQDLRTELSTTISSELKSVASAVVESDLKFQQSQSEKAHGSTWSPENPDFIPFGQMSRVFSIEEKVDSILAEVRASKDATEASRVAQQNIVDTCQKRVEAMELMIAEFQEKLDVTIAKLVQDIDENNQRDIIVSATVDQQLENINDLKGVLAETRAHAEAVETSHKTSVEEASLWREEQAAEMQRNAEQFGTWESSLRESVEAFTQRVDAVEATCGDCSANTAQAVATTEESVRRVDELAARTAAAEARVD